MRDVLGAGCLVMLFNLLWIALVVFVIITVARWALGI
jgi:hypothetical protein